MTLRSVPAACVALLVLWAPFAAAAPSEVNDAAGTGLALAEGVAVWAATADSPDDAGALVVLVVATTESGGLEVLGLLQPQTVGHRLPVGETVEKVPVVAIPAGGESALACVGIDPQSLSIVNNCTVQDFRSEGEDLLS